MSDLLLPRDLPRNLAYERALTATAATAAGSHGAAITRFAESRAPLEPVRDALARDFILEQAEEAADWRNYACWGMRQLDETRRQDPRARAARAELTQALGTVCVAWDHLLSAAVLLDRPMPA